MTTPLHNPKLETTLFVDLSLLSANQTISSVFEYQIRNDLFITLPINR